jgi:hypothetical protein
MNAIRKGASLFFAIALGSSVAMGDLASDCKDAEGRLKNDDALIARSLTQKSEAEARVRKCEADLKAGKVISCQALRDAVKGIDDVIRKQKDIREQTRKWMAKACK